MLLYYNWLQDKIANNVPINEMVQELLGANGRHVQEPGDELLSDRDRHSEGVGERRPGLHGHAHPVRPVPQSSVRPLDAWTITTASRRSSPRSAARGPTTRARLIVFNCGGGEVNAPGPRPVDAAEVPRRRGARRGRQGPPRGAGQLAGLAGESVLRHQPRQHRLGPLLRPGDHRRGGRRAHQQPGHRTRNCSTNWARSSPTTTTTSRSWSATSAPRGPISCSTQPNESNESDTRNFAHGRSRRIRAETMLDCITQVTDTKNKFQGLPLGARAVQIADGGVSTYFLTTFGRADARDGLLVRGAAGADAVAERCTCSTATRRRARSQQGNLSARCWQEKKTPAQIIEELYIRCLSRKPTAKETGKLDGARRGRDGQEAGARRRLLGAAELARVHVQPLIERRDSPQRTQRRTDEKKFER